MTHYIDHPVLYSDSYFHPEWEKLVEQSEGRSNYQRRFARRKMRRVINELLRGIRPRIFHIFDE